jgi:hypothetical protein
MKFMCPTWPIVGRNAASPLNTPLPPCRPATQVSPAEPVLGEDPFDA